MQRVFYKRCALCLLRNYGLNLIAKNRKARKIHGAFLFLFDKSLIRGIAIRYFEF